MRKMFQDQLSGNDSCDLDGFTFGGDPTNIDIYLVAKPVYEHYNDEEVTDEECKCRLRITMSEWEMS